MSEGETGAYRWCRVGEDGELVEVPPPPEGTVCVIHDEAAATCRCWLCRMSLDRLLAITMGYVIAISVALWVWLTFGR